MERRFFGHDGDSITVGIKLATAGAELGAVLGTLKGHYHGGYTGDVGRREVAGVVHGQEFVVNAAATAANRSLPEEINRSVPGYMRGGFGDPSRSVAVSSGAGAAIDYQRLADVVARNTRRLVGDVHIEPHNYSEFHREIDRARQMSRADGVRSGY